MYAYYVLLLTTIIVLHVFFTVVCYVVTCIVIHVHVQKAVHVCP